MAKTKSSRLEKPPAHTMTILMSPEELGRRLMQLALQYGPEIDAAERQAEQSRGT